MPQEEENKVGAEDSINTVEENSKVKEVSVPISQLEALIAQNEEFKRALMEKSAQEEDTKKTIDLLKTRVSELAYDATPVTEQVNEHTLRLRVVNDRPVVGFVNKATMKGKTKFVYQEVDPIIPTKINEYIDVKLHGIEEPVKMKYSEELMASDDVMTVKIIETKRIPKELIQGDTEKTEYNDWGSVSAGYRVPVKVTYEEIYHMVELPDGEVIKIEERVANII